MTQLLTKNEREFEAALTELINHAASKSIAPHSVLRLAKRARYNWERVKEEPKLRYLQD